jgi:hypothetical protein
MVLLLLTHNEDSMVQQHYHHAKQRRILPEVTSTTLPKDEAATPMTKRISIATMIPDRVPALLTWSDLNVIVRQEMHPSKMQQQQPQLQQNHFHPSTCMITKRKASSVFFWEEEDYWQENNRKDEVIIPIVRNDDPELMYIQQQEGWGTTKTTTKPKEEEHIQKSFGWSDFPLLVQPCNTTTLLLQPFDTPQVVVDDDTIVESSCPNNTTPSSTTNTSTDPCCCCCSSSPKKKHVRFGNVQIRRHDIELGDHPLCESFPVTLSWTYHDDETIMEMDAYEKSILQNHHRVSSFHHHRHHVPARMRAQQRRDRLAKYLQVETEEIEAMEAVRRDEQVFAYYDAYYFMESSSSATTKMIPRVPTLHVISDEISESGA